MDVSALSPQSGAAGLSAATDTEETGVISSDFETFLVMLTAQIQNQDPLNPMDSSDYAVQLATFSGVEQQVLTNELLREQSETVEQYNLATLAGWVGLEALTDGSTYYSGDPIKFDVNVSNSAEWAKLVITKPSGEVVSEVAVPPGSDTAQWAGTWDSGAEAEYGTYVAKLEVYYGGESSPTITELQSYGRIVEVRQSDGGFEVVLKDGTTLKTDQISSLRAPLE